MADTADVENALVAFLAQVLLPPGYTYGQAVEGLGGISIRLSRGWPVRQQLDSDLPANIVNITVFPRPEEQNTTRYERNWRLLVPHQHTITAVIAGLTVSFGGSVTAQNVGLIVNGVGYIYSTLPGDTLQDVVTGLAALVPGAITDGGTDLFLPPTTTQIKVTVGGFGTYSRELKRQLRNYQISFWSPTPALRDTLAGPVDVALAVPQWLSLPDLTVGRLRYHASAVDDGTEKAGVYCRHLFYSVEFGTVDVVAAPEVVIARADYSVVPNAAIIKQITV